MINLDRRERETWVLPPESPDQKSDQPLPFPGRTSDSVLMTMTVEPQELRPDLSQSHWKDVVPLGA